MEKGEETNWSEEVEGLVTAGDTQGAISFLENVLFILQTTSSSSSSDDLRLAYALSDLASLYSSIGFSLKSDELLSRAYLLKQRAHSSRPGTSLPKTTAISKNCPEADYSGDGIEIAILDLWA